jgi:glycosyltransferase involved in cell wall biosynthesis
MMAKHPNLVAVCPSRWLAEEAERGLWKGHCIEQIPYGLPLETYHVMERKQARAELGLDPSFPVVVTAAQNLNERRKGGDILVDTLRNSWLPPFTLVTLGHGRNLVPTERVSVHHLGYVHTERTKVLAYNAANLLLHPAPVDNLPNVILEAIACGTPVVGFPAGGVKEVVRPSQTGWLADEVSPGALARAVARALADVEKGVNLRQSCRSTAEVQYGIELQARRYVDLFNSVAGSMTRGAHE